jgi:hypothetical protein
VNTIAPMNSPRNVLPNAPAVRTASSTSSNEIALSKTPDPKAITRPSSRLPGGATTATVAPSTRELAASNPQRPASNIGRDG